MAKTPEPKEAKVKGMLVAGYDEFTIANEVGVSRAIVNKFKKEMDGDAMDVDIDLLSRQVAPSIVKKVAEKVRDVGPLAFENEVDKVISGIDSLQKLELRFHNTFTTILDKADTILEKEDLKTTEWKSVTDTLARAFKEIYNSRGTTINVANADNINGQQANSLTMFQSRM